MTTRVGFIGLGNIGKPMAINVATAGFDLMVYDVRQEPLQELAALGAKVARSAQDVGAHGDVIEVVVVDDAQVEAVTVGEGGVLNGTKPGSVIAIHSTVHPKTVRRIAELARARGVGVIDAQVSGGERGAQQKTLCYMVGGDKALLDKCRPVFATSGAHIFHLGDLGSGAIAKLAHNLIVYVNMLAASEGMRLGEKAGLDVTTLQDVVHVSAGQSRVADNWLQQRKLKETYTAGPGALMQLIYKDLRLALELGHDLGLSLPGAALTQQLIDRLLEISE
jgi:3-hydroxyisobutyrate dehydrogenase-like beta-hydroxyacid dehydrogenase